MKEVAIDEPSPLRECLRHCEVKCRSECCGISAFSPDSALITAWCQQVGPANVAEAARQLACIIASVEDRAGQVSLTVLNHYTFDEAARVDVLELLAAFRSGLAAAAEPGAAVAPPEAVGH